MTANEGGTGLTLSACEEALTHVSARDRTTRVRIGEALLDHFGDQAFEVFDSWYSTHDRYTKGDAKAAWRSFGKGSSSPATIGTLIYEAKLGGWKPGSQLATKGSEVRLRMERRRNERGVRTDEVSAAELAAAARAKTIWDAADLDPTDHAYLARKGVKATGLRRAREWVTMWKDDAGEEHLFRNADPLLVPIWSAPGELASLQAIFPIKCMGNKRDGRARDKDYLRDGRKRGCYFIFGHVQVETKLALFCEGYATGASLHEATNLPVFVCFDAHNIEPVAVKVRKKLANLRIVICADNDQFTKRSCGAPHNPGVEAAMKAARAALGVVAAPQFQNLEDEPTDFNDMHGLLGLDAVREAIEKVTVRPITVVLAPDREAATAVAYAMRAIDTPEATRDKSLFACRAPSDLVLHVYGNDLSSRAADLCHRHPSAHLFILARVGDEQGAIAVAQEHGVRAESLEEFSNGRYDNWFDALMAAADTVGDSDAAASKLAEQALVQAMDPMPELKGPSRVERRRQQQEENCLLQKLGEGAMVPSALTLDEMLKHCVWIADGKFVAYVTVDRSLFLKFNEFRALTTQSKTEVKKGDKTETLLVATADLWSADMRRISAMTRTFRPGAELITFNPNGLRAANTWRPIQRWPSTVDITPFIDQIKYMIDDPTECKNFLDWLAHIEQKPGQLPHYGYLLIATHTGTGRNWMGSLLARVFLGYVAPNVDLSALLNSQFNGELGGRVLAIVDEVQEGASDQHYRQGERLKSMVNAEMRKINDKYGLQYLEVNACRWLVFSNHENALPLTEQDRRFRVKVNKKPPRPPEVYEKLYDLLKDEEFINAVGVFLRERDISSFRPGERPPLTADKRAAITASKPMMSQNAEEILAFWPADVITNRDLSELLGGDREFTPAMRRAMEEAGAISWQQNQQFKLKIAGIAHRLWILRDHARWLGESTDSIRIEVSRSGVVDGARPASVVLADAAEAKGVRDPF